MGDRRVVRGMSRRIVEESIEFGQEDRFIVVAAHLKSEVVII
jgi:hypothetical protein